jgi:hypothetical protein
VTATATRFPLTRQRALVVGAVVVLVGVLIFLVVKGPSEPTPGPIAGDPPATPIVVSVNRHGSGPAHLGYPVLISASAIGRTGIAGMELWVGGTLLEASATPNPERPAATMEWSWTPAEAGDTILVARAFDGEGRTGQSSAVRITVDEGSPRSWQVIEVTAAAGETLTSVIEANGGDLEQAAAFNPDLSPSEPFTAETVVNVPILEEGPGLTAAAALAGAHIAFAAPLPVGLVAPNPVVAVDGCTLKVSNSTPSVAAIGYQLDVLPPGGTAFLPIAKFAPAPGGDVSGSTLALGGVNYVTLSAYSADVAAPSAIVPISVPDSCNDGWTGEARLDGTELVLPGPVDQAYFYLAVGDGAWQRVPAQQGTFIKPVAGKLDAAGLLPSLGGQPLRLQAWGWKDGALVSRGIGTYTPPGGQQLYSGALAFAGQGALGFGTTLDIVQQVGGGEFSEILTHHSAVDRPGPGSGSASRTFKWSTTLQGVTHLVWQILPYPLADSPSLTPPFLVDSSTFATNGATSGYFKIDFKKYLIDKVGIASASSWADQQLLGQVSQKPFFPGGPSPTPAAASGAVVTVQPGGPFLPPSGGSAGTAALDNLALFAPPLSTIYVRVIPMLGTIPAGAASNSVSLDVIEPEDPFYIDTSPPPVPPSYDDAYQMSAVFYSPTGSIFKYTRCVKVITPPALPPPAWAGSWAKDTVHCYVEPDDDFDLADAFSSFVEWVGTAWDYISEGYDWIQNKVVDVVLAIVPCEQIASKVADNAKDTCRAIAKTTLQAVAVAYGVPPELPNWKATISGLKGDLRTFILENAKTLSPVGDACDAADVAHGASSSFPTCDALIDKAIDEAVAQIMVERSEAAAKVAGVPTYGAIVELDPRGRAQPPHFAVTLTRTNAPIPAGTVCQISGSMVSTVANWQWAEYQWTNGVAKTVGKSGPVSGEPFLDNSIEFPVLAPGESYSFEVWMSKPATWFEPDGWNDHYAQQYAEWNGQFNHAWVLLQKGAQVTGKLTSNCAPDGAANETLTGNAWD